MDCFKRFRHIDSHFANKQILKGFERSNHRRVNTFYQVLKPNYSTWQRFRAVHVYIFIVLRPKGIFRKEYELKIIGNFTLKNYSTSWSDKTTCTGTTTCTYSTCTCIFLHYHHVCTKPMGIFGSGNFEWFQMVYQQDKRVNVRQIDTM